MSEGGRRPSPVTPQPCNYLAMSRFPSYYFRGHVLDGAAERVGPFLLQPAQREPIYKSFPQHKQEHCCGCHSGWEMPYLFLQKLLAEAKICQNHVAFAVQKNVFQFDVSVHDPELDNKKHGFITVWRFCVVPEDKL